MSTIRTDDGFEFETTTRPGEIRCVCRRDGRETTAVVSVDDETADLSILIEQFEMLARTCWEAGPHLHQMHARLSARKAADGEPPSADDEH